MPPAPAFVSLVPSPAFGGSVRPTLVRERPARSLYSCMFRPQNVVEEVVGLVRVHRRTNRRIQTQSGPIWGCRHQHRRDIVGVEASVLEPQIVRGFLLDAPPEHSEGHGLRQGPLLTLSHFFLQTIYQKLLPRPVSAIPL
jgi:hypothetical protein